jgi:hypothetical protein
LSKKTAAVAGLPKGGGGIKNIPSAPFSLLGQLPKGLVMV